MDFILQERRKGTTPTKHTHNSAYFAREGLKKKKNRKTLFTAASNEMRWVGSPQTAHPGELLVAAVPEDPHSCLQ